jgi:formylglycine-generating enzyme required for sulfatase activity
MAIATRRKFIKIAAFTGVGIGAVVLMRKVLEGNSQSLSIRSTSSTINSQNISLQTFDFDVVTVNYEGKEINRSSKQAKSFKEDLVNGVTLEMVAIPGGTFPMGSPTTEKGRINDESPQHSVTVKPFYMGKFPVTQAQWQAIIETNPSNFKGDNLPVESVSWNEAIEFCQRLSQKTGRNYRLPSEAEWEYACRAGTTTPFHFGETITTELANYNGNFTYGSEPKGTYREKTAPIGSFGVANAFGLYDMHGNVLEWCQDNWHDNYNGAPTDGSAWEGRDRSARLLRGGSWGDYPGYCRSATRGYSNPDNRHYFIGCRVVVS